MTESASSKDQRPYERFTLKMAVELAAPHTWPASILPVLVATSCAVVHSPALDVLMVCALLAICILMQASVNTFNDYYDFVKGADSEEDNVDVTDAVLVYNHINPASALRLAVGLLVAAFAIGVYVIYCAGWIPLVLGITGAVIVVSYSAGKTPISYLPIGEVVSGFVMGGLIPLACYQVLTGELDFVVLVWSIPTIIGIGLIMMTNNTCDIEKDIEVSRRTLPTLLGLHARRDHLGIRAVSFLSFVEGALEQPPRSPGTHWGHGADLQREHRAWVVLRRRNPREQRHRLRRLRGRQSFNASALLTAVRTSAHIPVA